MLLDRGFQPSTERRTVDRRRTSDLKPLLIRRAESRPRTSEPALHLSRKGSTSASHLQRQKTALPTLFGDEESRAPDPAKVDQRMRQKLHRLQQETGRRAHELRQRSNAQGIFDDRVNKVRATSTCLSDLRRSTSFVEMRTQVRPPTLSLLVHDQPLPPARDWTGGVRGAARGPLRAADEESDARRRYTAGQARYAAARTRRIRANSRFKAGQGQDGEPPACSYSTNLAAFVYVQM